ncbi:MAG: hypothetical protein ABJA37_07875 [Ferruginibacter sp.]
MITALQHPPQGLLKSISGTIKGNNGNDLARATLYLPTLKKGTLTGSTGEYM